jgi:hypothetical protein
MKQSALRLLTVNAHLTGHLNEEALDRVLWITRFVKGYVSDARQILNEMNS